MGTGWYGDSVSAEQRAEDELVVLRVFHMAFEERGHLNWHIDPDGVAEDLAWDYDRYDAVVERLVDKGYLEMRTMIGASLTPEGLEVAEQGVAIAEAVGRVEAARKLLRLFHRYRRKNPTGVVIVSVDDEDLASLGMSRTEFITALKELVNAGLVKRKGPAAGSLTPEGEKTMGNQRLVKELLPMPGSVTEPSTRDTEDEDVTEPKHEDRYILFMDVSGWSGLGAGDIQDFVMKGMPALKPVLGEPKFRNTWGDAIVATYDDLEKAVDAAIGLRDFFRKGNRTVGLKPELKARIALHHGHVLECNNALTGNRDIFGHHVHVAARLEPATAPGHVFCTSFIAEGLKGRGDMIGYKAWEIPSALRLPKSFGEVRAFVLTLSGEDDPLPSLEPFLKGKTVSTETPQADGDGDLLEGDDAVARIAAWLDMLDPDIREVNLTRLDTELGLRPGQAGQHFKAVANQTGWDATGGAKFLRVRYHGFV